MERNFPDWIEAYLSYTRHTESPERFNYWAAVSTLAGLLKRQVWIDMGEFEWIPNFYIVFVAPPGVAAKSTTAGIGMKMLKEMGVVHFGPDAGTWQGLIKLFPTAQESVDLPDGTRRVMSAVTLSISELGTFYRPDEDHMTDILVDLWDGKDGAWNKSTVISGNEQIISPCLNLIGCTTPSWIQRNVPEYMISGGFTSRTIFVFGDEKRQLVAYPGLVSPKSERETHRKKLIEDLWQIHEKFRGEVVLDPEAILFGQKWYEHHWNSPRPTHLNSDRYDGYFARKQTAVHKMAMVIAAARRNTPIILKEDLEAAISRISSIEADMIQVFSRIGSSDEAQAIEALIKCIRRSRRITQADAWRMLINQIGDYRRFLAAIHSAQKAGLIKVTGDWMEA